eukprot:3214857-Prymnesium_polylepis.1
MWPRRSSHIRGCWRSRPRASCCGRGRCCAGTPSERSGAFSRPQARCPRTRAAPSAQAKRSCCGARTSDEV